MSLNVAQNIVQQRTDVLLPYARNSRTHSDEQVAQIAASIREFGFTNPVLVDADNGIVAGHGRVMAAAQMGLATVPTINVGWMTDVQRRAYIIADNKLAANAGWDDDTLRAEMAALTEMNFDLDLTGFSAEELEALALDDAGGEGDPADQPEKGNLSDRFMIPPFSVLNAREGWWQNRKRAWLALGIKSELGRGGGLTMTSAQVTSAGLNYYRDAQRQAAAPGGSARPACDYSNKQRGDGAGRPING